MAMEKWFILFNESSYHRQKYLPFGPYCNTRSSQASGQHDRLLHENGIYSEGLQLSPGCLGCLVVTLLLRMFITMFLTLNMSRLVRQVHDLEEVVIPALDILALFGSYSCSKE